VKATATTSNSLGINSYGAGLSLYLDSINAYISADVGTAKTQLTVTNTQAYSESGLGINVLIGKEWWVSKNWGLGAALFYHYSSMNDVATGSVVPKITNSVFGLALQRNLQLISVIPKRPSAVWDNYQRAHNAQVQRPENPIKHLVFLLRLMLPFNLSSFP
jgi:hypothetical protein